MLIPPNLDEGALRAIYERLDGLLLAGGEEDAPPMRRLFEDFVSAARRWDSESTR